MGSLWTNHLCSFDNAWRHHIWKSYWLCWYAHAASTMDNLRMYKGRERVVSPYSASGASFSPVPPFILETKASHPLLLALLLSSLFKPTLQQSAIQLWFLPFRIAVSIRSVQRMYSALVAGPFRKDVSIAYMHVLLFTKLRNCSLRNLSRKKGIFHSPMYCFLLPIVTGSQPLEPLPFRF